MGEVDLAGPSRTRPGDAPELRHRLGGGEPRARGAAAVRLDVRAVAPHPRTGAAARRRATGAIHARGHPDPCGGADPRARQEDPPGVRRTVRNRPPRRSQPGLAPGRPSGDLSRGRELDARPGRRGDYRGGRRCRRRRRSGREHAPDQEADRRRAGPRDPAPAADLTRSPQLPARRQAHAGGPGAAPAPGLYRQRSRSAT